MKTVGEVSELAGVTVRTLHHYDEIGLLSPRERTEAGYRLYSYEDLERRQEVLVWRQLGFTLQEIKAPLDEPEYDRGDALERQREFVQHDLERIGTTARALDEAIQAHRGGIRQKVEKMFEGFDHSQYEDEVHPRWGHTDAYRQSKERTARYGEAEWAEIRAEADQSLRDFAELMRDGEPTSGERARAAAERHRQHINRWFYECSPQMHRGLANLFVTDVRFERNYEQVADGLARFVHDAIVANAEAQPRCHSRLGRAKPAEHLTAGSEHGCAHTGRRTG
jgi:DNA-binding transcriptional MerR regulator